MTTPGRLIPMSFVTGTYDSLDKTPHGLCLCCGFYGPLAVWKDEALSLVTHGVCAPCRDKARA